ncbi:chlorophyllide a oxygenase [Elysia marginata]|uniref:cholesterol 7-desaturase n=1 Tax=Elysia marginata TaxID=1093978 RepID=A0AAV4IL21_9GAST|nr:chlorophyllide a oxygenase [Elysia marginata]
MPVRRLLLAIFMLVFTIAVSASVTEKILQIPLIEVGGLWVKAMHTASSRLAGFLTFTPDLTSPWTYARAAILAWLGYALWAFFWRPLNRVRKLGDVGYVAEGSFTTKETANFIQRRKKNGEELPPFYPNGWFGLMESFCLKKGESQALNMLGMELVIYRGQNNRVYVLDPYCPHNGGHLGVGGRVVGNCLECPFHAWTFRGEDGKCVSIPYMDKSAKIPSSAKVKSHIVTELNGWIYLWHHAEGLEPNWSVPEIEEIATGQWTYRGRTEHHINCHIEEIPENGADLVHLGQVHGPIFAAGVDLRTMWSTFWSFAQHHWSADWSPCPEPDGHIGEVKLKHALALFGRMFPGLDLDVTAKQIGPGIVYLYFESVLGPGVYLQHVTPMGPLHQKVTHNIYVNTYIVPPVAKFYMLGEALMVERDIMIWNNKQYVRRPLYVASKEDKLVKKHREWYSQFYSKLDKPVLRKDNTLDF